MATLHETQVQFREAVLLRQLVGLQTRDVRRALAIMIKNICNYSALLRRYT